MNLLTETAAIKLRPGVDHTQAASELAAVITAQGFPSTVREQSSEFLLPPTCYGTHRISLGAWMRTIPSRLHCVIFFFLRARSPILSILALAETMRDPGEVAEERERAVRKATIDVIVAWTLALVCCSHHIGHVLHFLGVHSLAHHPALMAMHNPWVSALTAAVALLGPGRSVLADGFRSLSKGNPNMNSLVGLGCTASFG